MASIIFNNGVPASHSQDARRSQRVYADVQVVNEGNADGFVELVLMGDLNGTSGVQEVRRGGGGALLKAYSNYISGVGTYRVSAIVFEIVNGQRVSPFLARHDNFTANVPIPRGGGGGGWGTEEDDGNGNGNGDGDSTGWEDISEEAQWTDPVVVEVADPWQTEESDWVEPVEDFQGTGASEEAYWSGYGEG